MAGRQPGSAVPKLRPLPQQEGRDVQLRFVRRIRQRGIAAAVATLSAFSACLLNGLNSAAYAQAPTVVYAPEGTRQMLFVNNPERLEIGFTDLVTGSLTYGTTFSDLADANLGRKNLFQMTVAPGSYRNLFEHAYNLTRATTPAAANNPIRYGIAVYNPNKFNISLTVYGKGFVTGPNGGQPFVDALNSTAAPTTYTLQRGQTVWIFRSEIDFPLFTITPGNFFTGLVDFDIAGGSAVVTNLAYQTFNENYGRMPLSVPMQFEHLNASSGPENMGFAVRRYTAAATPESRVYKGLMTYPNSGVGSPSGSGVVTNLSFTVNDSTPAASELPVTYPIYAQTAAGSGIWAASATNFSGTGWFTHNVPLRDTATIKVVANDMFNIITPGYGTLYALNQSNAPNTPFGQANFGNWGIIYHDSITVTNTGTRDRAFALHLNNMSGGNSPIAYRNGSGVWQQTIVRGAPVAYYNFAVPAGQTVTVDGYFTLGCPGVGTLKHAVFAID
jgi:hypothetical protein